jgi:hypothetical protein
MEDARLKNTAKDKWNREHYTQIKVSVPPDVAAAFKSSCADAGTSMSGALKSFMIELAGIAKSNTGTLPLVSTRRQRRKEIQTLLKRLNRVLDAEERCMNNIPENLRGSSVYEAGENITGLLSDAIISMEEIYG